MDSFVTGLWTVGLTVGVIISLWLWTRTKRESVPGEKGSTLKVKVRGWLGAVGQQDFLNEEERVERLHRELTTRLANLERELIHRDQLEHLAVDLRRRLHRLEKLSLQESPDSQAHDQVIPRSVLRLGVRMTLTDFLWKELGIVQPSDLPDYLLEKLFQGPFCRNCLRSLVLPGFVDGERLVRFQCRHCLLSWRADPKTTTMPLHHLKRELYELLDAEYRDTGAIGPRDET